MDQLPAPYAAAPVNVNVVTANQSHGFIVRALWFFCVGWWLGGLVISLAYLLLPWIITTPASFWLFNRIGSAMTLRPRRHQWDYTATASGYAMTQRRVAQRPWYLRTVWFVLVGWWLGAIWLAVAYVCCLLLLTMPIGIVMIDRTPGVVTLQRN